MAGAGVSPGAAGGQIPGARRVPSPSGIHVLSIRRTRRGNSVLTPKAAPLVRDRAMLWEARDPACGGGLAAVRSPRAVHSGLRAPRPLTGAPIFGPLAIDVQQEAPEHLEQDDRQRQDEQLHFGSSLTYGRAELRGRTQGALTRGLSPPAGWTPATAKR